MPVPPLTPPFERDERDLFKITPSPADKLDPAYSPLVTPDEKLAQPTGEFYFVIIH